MTRNTIEVPDEARERAIHAYLHEHHRTLEEIGLTELGVGKNTFARLCKEWRLPKRASARAASRRANVDKLKALPALPARAALADALSGDLAQEQESDPAPAGASALALPDLIQRLLRQVAARISEAEAADLEPERAMRLASAATKNLSILHALATQAGGALLFSEADDQSEPRPLDELREELARHLDRLVEGEALERGFGAPHPSGDPQAA